jgi:hypothetical protein
MWEFLAIAVIGSVFLAAFAWIVIYRAMGNLIDWLILTFGNEESVRRVKSEKGWTDE